MFNVFLSGVPVGVLQILLTKAINPWVCEFEGRLGHLLLEPIRVSILGWFLVLVALFVLVFVAVRNWELTVLETFLHELVVVHVLEIDLFLLSFSRIGLGRVLCGGNPYLLRLLLLGILLL